MAWCIPDVARRKIDERLFRSLLDITAASLDRHGISLKEVLREVDRSLDTADLDEETGSTSGNPGVTEGHAPGLTRLYWCMSKSLQYASDEELKQVVARCRAEIGKLQDIPSLDVEQVLPGPERYDTTQGPVPAWTAATWRGGGPGSADPGATTPQAVFFTTAPRAPSHERLLFFRAQYLLDRIYMLLRNIKEREYARVQSVFYTGYALLLAFGLLSWMYLGLSLLVEAVDPLIWWVMGFGALGSTTSVLQRLQKSVKDDYSIAYLVRLRHGQVSLGVSVWLGSVFALVLILLVSSGFAGAVLNDRFLAGIGTLSGQAWSFRRYLVIDLGAESPSFHTLSGLLVLAFVSGFSERFVPDVLTRVELESRLVKGGTHP